MWHEKTNVYKITAKDGKPHILYACDQRSTKWLIDKLDDATFNVLMGSTDPTPVLEPLR